MKAILFIDGQCVLCHRFAKFILSEDKGNVFRLAALQGETARQSLPPEYIENPKTVVLQDEEGIYTESQAIIRCLDYLGGRWRLLTILRWLPQRMRNFLYQLVARYRYKIFGRYDSCRLPSAREKEKLLP